MQETSAELTKSHDDINAEINEEVKKLMVSGATGTFFYPSGGGNGLRPGERFQDARGRWYYVESGGNFIRTDE